MFSQIQVWHKAQKNWVHNTRSYQQGDINLQTNEEPLLNGRRLLERGGVWDKLVMSCIHATKRYTAP